MPGEQVGRGGIICTSGLPDPIGLDVLQHPVVELMERSYRPLLPSKAFSGSSEKSMGWVPDHVIEARKKRQQIIVACNACRKRKSKVRTSSHPCSEFVQLSPLSRVLEHSLIRFSVTDKDPPAKPAATRRHVAPGQLIRTPPRSLLSNASTML